MSTSAVTVTRSVTQRVYSKEKSAKFKEFLRMEKPWGLEQHIFHWLWVGSAHVLAAYYTYLSLTGYAYAPYSTIMFEFVYGYIGGLGITVGCHRYWTHKTFKANLPLQYLLMIMQTISNQYSIYKWSLDHRIHHKFTDTDMDPHNSRRGFWFSHMGWLFLPKHPKLKETLKTFDMPDLENDPVVRFQSKWYWTLTAVFHLIVPIAFIHYVWGIPIFYCYAANARRYIISLHFTWTVNSIAHMWGDKPYDKSITPVQNPVVSLLAVGEGWHNYHHTFPWDYQASEYGWKINVSTMLIDCFAWMGWAYDLKTVSQKMLKERLTRTGDGSHIMSKTAFETDVNENSKSADVTEYMKTSLDQPLWGWDDEGIPEEFRVMTKILSPSLKNN